MEKTIARLLRRADKAHKNYEKLSGKADKNWPRWYANYIVGQLGYELRNRETEQ